MTEIIDTSGIQLRSVFAFAQALGYEFNRWPLECKGFYSRLPANRHRANVSFRTMCSLHIGNLLDWHGDRYRDPWNFDSYSFIQAQAAKIVRQAKLIHNKKTNTVRCQSFIVEFAKASYAPLFLPALYEND